MVAPGMLERSMTSPEFIMCMVSRRVSSGVMPRR